MSYPAAHFLDAIRDVSAGNTKIAQRDFLSNGALAIVDQGQQLIAGYTDDVSASVKSELPLIIFGDHTRAFKFIDFPFAMGADGVKVLQVSEGFDPRFVYHFLRSRRIPSAGYSRHFKFLKEILIPHPPLSEQRRIATVLDQADALRAKRRHVLDHLNVLTQSIFNDMFRDESADWTLGDVAEIQGGLQISAARAKLPLEVPYLRVANVHRGRLDLTEVKTLRVTAAEIARTRLRSGDLLFVEGHANPNEVGRVGVWEGDVETCVHQNHLIRGRLDDSRALPVYASTWFNTIYGAAHFRRAGKTTSGLNTISASTVRSAPMPLPSIDRQHKFATRHDAIRRQHARARSALLASDELFDSLQLRAFRGEL